MGAFFDRINKQLFGENTEPPKDASDQSPDERSLVAHIRQKVEESRISGSRVAQESVWMTNVAYLMGYTGYQYDAQLRTYKNVDNYRKGGMGLNRRSRVNKILPTCQNRLARICKSPPKYDTRPESSSTDDKDAARLSIQAIENIWDKQKINLKRLNLGMVLQQAGYGFIQVCWDDSLGQMILNPETGEMDYEGDIRIDVASPFEVYSDPLAKNMEECTWIVRAKVRKLDYFKERYPLGYLVKEEDAWLLSAQYEMKINDLNGAGMSSSNYQAQMKNSAIELCYYEKRSKKHPNGRMVVCASGVLLEDKELPVGKIPLVKFDDIMIGNRFASEAIITHLRPIQDRFDRLLMKRDRYVDKVLAGKYRAARGHGLMSEAFDDQTGEILEYDPVPNAPPPEPMPLVQMPQWAYAEEERLDDQFDSVSGINEVSRGELPSASIPAQGMAFLQEQDQTRLGVITIQHEMAWAEVGQLILMYMGEYYKSPRMLKIAGDGLEYAVKNFIGADLRNNYDVFVVPGSTDPGSKVLKRQDILTAFREGLLGDPADPKLREKVLKMLEYGDIDEVWQDQAIDMAQIKNQIEQIEQGMVPEQNELDNHPLHIQEKNRYRKTEKFKQLSPMAQQVLLADIEYHVQAMVDLSAPDIKQNQEMAQEMAQATDQMPDQAVPEVATQLPQESGVAA